MNKFTALFLILLRLTIGWHFFAEGFHKLEGYWRGPTETVVGKSRPFTSAGYFREGTGPLAKLIDPLVRRRLATVFVAMTEQIARQAEAGSAGSRADSREPA